MATQEDARRNPRSSEEEKVLEDFLQEEEAIVDGWG